MFGCSFCDGLCHPDVRIPNAVFQAFHRGKADGIVAVRQLNGVAHEVRFGQIHNVCIELSGDHDLVLVFLDFQDLVRRGKAAVPDRVIDSVGQRGLVVIRDKVFHAEDRKRSILQFFFGDFPEFSAVFTIKIFYGIKNTYFGGLSWFFRCRGGVNV